MVNWHCTWGCLTTVLPVVCASHWTTISMLAPWKLNWISSALVPVLFVLVKASDGTHGPPLLPESDDGGEGFPLGGVGMPGGMSGAAADDPDDLGENTGGHAAQQQAANQSKDERGIRARAGLIFSGFIGSYGWFR